jgi:flavin-dependent dehydrogenase
MMFAAPVLNTNEGLSELSKTQVLICGGGPAGSTAAMALAREGFTVTLLDKQCFPRHKIGESLLPSVMELLKEFDESNDITENPSKEKESSGLFKTAVSLFTSKPGGLFSLRSSLSGAGEDVHHGKEAHFLPMPRRTIQADRSVLDYLLIQRAKNLGAKVYEGTNVVKVCIYWKEKYSFVTNLWTLKTRLILKAKQLTGRTLRVVRRDQFSTTM